MADRKRVSNHFLMDHIEKLMSLKNRISSLKKNNTKGDWQRVHLIKVSRTNVIQTWIRIPTKKSNRYFSLFFLMA